MPSTKDATRSLIPSTPAAVACERFARQKKLRRPLPLAWPMFRVCLPRTRQISPPLSLRTLSHWTPASKQTTSHPLCPPGRGGRFPPHVQSGRRSRMRRHLPVDFNRYVAEHHRGSLVRSVRQWLPRGQNPDRYSGRRHPNLRHGNTRLF